MVCTYFSKRKGFFVNFGPNFQGLVPQKIELESSEGKGMGLNFTGKLHFQS